MEFKEKCDVIIVKWDSEELDDVKVYTRDLFGRD